MTDQQKNSVNGNEVETFGRRQFSAGMYSLELSSVTTLSLKLDGEAATFADAYRKLRNSKIQEMPTPGFNDETYRTDTGDVRVEGDWTLLSVLRTLMQLTRQGIDPFRAAWFYFDHDSSLDGDECYRFFVSHDTRIVMEDCSFTNHEPMMLKKNATASPWKSHRFFSEAAERYWYRKFYSETATGQLMVLRSDQPTLYHYKRPIQARDTARNMEVGVLLKVHDVHWVVVPLLAAIAFPRQWPFMALAASVLLVRALLRSWGIRSGRG